MSESLVSIYRHRCENAGGVVRVKLVLPEDVLSYASTTEEAGVELKPGKEVYHIEVDPFTGYHYEKLNANSDQEDYHTRGIGFDIRRLRQEKVTLRRRLMNRRVHVIFTDENGLTSLYLYMRLRRAEAENRYGAKNRTEFEFTGSGLLPSQYVIGELLPEPEPDEDPMLPAEGGAPIGPADDVTEGGGDPGGGPDDDLGGPDPGPGGGDPGDPGGGDPDPTDVTFLQPSTGDRFRITIGECEEIITTKVTP